MSLFRAFKSRVKSLRRKKEKMGEFAPDQRVLDGQEDFIDRDEQGDRPYSLEEKFRACVDIIQNLPKTGPVQTTYNEMLTYYAWYKQATEGPCRTSQPGFWNVIDRYKWDAWHKLGEMDREEAMDKYVVGVLEKIDFCAEQWDWDEMMKKYAKDYDKMEPVLRKNFRIIDRELIKGEKSRVPPSSTASPASFNPRQRSTSQLTVEIPKEDAVVIDHPTPNDPLSDAEYCDARDDHSLSRSSSLGSLNDHRHSPGRVRSLKAYCARMDVELRAINAALNALSAATEARHQSIIKLIKNSAVYIAVPSRLSWRSLFFFLVWPFIVHWAIKYFGGPAAIERLY